MLWNKWRKCLSISLIRIFVLLHIPGKRYDIGRQTSQGLNTWMSCGAWFLPVEFLSRRSSKDNGIIYEKTHCYVSNSWQVWSHSVLV
jgi:hypothetical protein